MNSDETKQLPRKLELVSNREYKVDPMWSEDEDVRRIAIAKRAAAGARKALAAR